MNIETKDFQEIVDNLPAGELKDKWGQSIIDVTEEEQVRALKMKLLQALSNPIGLPVPTTLEEIQTLLTTTNDEVTTAISKRPPPIIKDPPKQL